MKPFMSTVYKAEVVKCEKHLLYVTLYMLKGTQSVFKYICHEQFLTSMNVIFFEYIV